MRSVSKRIRRVAALLALVVVLGAQTVFADDPGSADTQSPDIVQQILDALALAARIGVPLG
jgi:hypothetical protein